MRWTPAGTVVVEDQQIVGAESGGGDAYLNESPVSFVEPAKIQAALRTLAEIAAPKDQANMDSEESAARGMVLEGVYMTTALQRADLTNSSATQLIKHLERLKAAFGALGDVASELSKSYPKTQAHADALEEESTAYAAEAENCRNTLKRNQTMLPFIETAGRNPGNARLSVESRDPLLIHFTTPSSL